MSCVAHFGIAKRSTNEVSVLSLGAMGKTLMFFTVSLLIVLEIFVSTPENKEIEYQSV